MAGFLRASAPLRLCVEAVRGGRFFPAVALLLAACSTHPPASPEAGPPPSTPAALARMVLTVREDRAGLRSTVSVGFQDNGPPIPCRVYLHDAAGKAIRPPGLPFWKDHFVCAGTAELELPKGDYVVEIERGPEWHSYKGTIMAGPGPHREYVFHMPRLGDLAADGWWSGDLHVHRPPKDIELLMRAEDLHVAPVITWWNARSVPAADLPARTRWGFLGDRLTDVLAGEDERAGGALLYFNLLKPLDLPKGGSRDEVPSPMVFLAEAKKCPGAHVDIEKPFWWDVPTWLASGQIDTMEIACNHMLHGGMHPNEAWGRPRDLAKYPAPLGGGFYVQDIYYHALNCGLRIPPSAGSASGVMHNPVGYNRVYVHVDGELTWEKWWEGLRAGRSFVTNGPLLRVTANGELPGHVFTAPEGQELTIELEADLISREPVPALEVVRDGRIEQVPFAVEAGGSRRGGVATLTFKESGWFLVRAIADVPHTFRFASTAPWYVEVGPAKRRVSRASARFFLDWVRERIARVNVEDPAQREDVLRPHHAAERFWAERAEQANAE